ncbi:MAG TPA: zinc-binding dehydrogenase [Candidatus Limnocylindrales bacterium]|nr:zinc-binding dehydrogenase [Candidatus Limnocylindrales bacterium]
MKAVMKVAPGVGHVELRDIPEPQAGPGQVKIKVHAAGICGTDLHIYKDEFRSCPPVVLGHEVAGEVVDLGEGVEGVSIGQRVTTETYFITCGKCRYCRTGHANLCLSRRSIGSGVNGGFTNYVVVPFRNIHALPESVDYRAGALTEPLACVVHAVLTTPTISPGDVAVIAGPGAIGLLTLQVVKAAGGTAVVLGTNGDEQRLALARELGADHVVNVQETDPAALVADLTPEGLGADVVYECSGAGPAAQQLLTLPRRGARYVQIGLFGKPVAWDLDQVCFRELIVTGSNASVPSAWIRALQLLESGLVRTKPLITADYEVTDWQEAFDGFEKKTAIKTLLIPAQ